MVTWRHTSLYKHWYRLITVEPRLRSLKRGLVISRFFSIHYTVTGAENIVRLYRGLRYIEFRYIEVPLYERERELGLTPLPRFWFLPQFSHSHPFESRLIPTPSVVEIRNGSQLIPSTIFLYQSVSNRTEVTLKTLNSSATLVSVHISTNLYVIFTFHHLLTYWFCKPSYTVPTWVARN